MNETSTGASERTTRQVRRTPLLRRRVSTTALVAAAAVAITGMRYDLTLNVTLGTVTALALAPVWLPRLRAFRGGVTIMVLALACLPLGVWLTVVSSAERPVSGRLLVESSILLLNFALGLGVLLWARTVMPTAVVAAVFGFGMLVVAPSAGRFDENPWRFGFAVPLSVLLLALTWHSGRRWVEVVVALALAAAAAASGGRSLFAILLLAAVLSAWQAAPRLLHVGASRLRSVLFLGAAVGALFALGQSLLLEGYLGENAQERTVQQISTSGSVLLGARPEMGATIALVPHEPFGFGAGARLNSTDLLVAKSGMSELGYDPDNGYVERYMFGTGIELHSFWADLWADFGLLGAALGGVIAWRLVSYLSASLAQRAASALVAYLVVQNVWSMLFSPRFSTYTLMVLAVAMTLTSVSRPTSSRAEIS